MDKAAFANTEHSWWLVEASAPAGVDSMRSQIGESLHLGAEWYHSSAKLEELYDFLSNKDSGLLAELDDASDADKQANWLTRAAAVAKPEAAHPAQSAASVSHAVSGDDGSDPAVPAAPALTEEDIAALAAAVEVDVDPSFLEGMDLAAILADEVDIGDDDGREGDVEE